MKKIIYSFSFTVAIVTFFALYSPHHARGQQASTCFTSDPAMGSTNIDDHYNWAQGKDASVLETNLKSKINLLYNCPSINGGAFAAVFADVSVVIATSVRNASCFNNDPGAIGTDRSSHYNWARNSTRQQVLQNLQWKIGAAFKCLDSKGQRTFFANASVPIAQTSPANGSSQTSGEWRVWVKTSPCSGRNDWISVAKENPTGGGNFFYRADFLFPGTTCTSMGCTFMDANAVANTLRNSSEFLKYCCRDYSVWKNIQTGRISVVQGKFGTAGFGWELVKGDLCYDEAQAMANADQYGDWKVWVRTSPCSGRYDWISVARENPTAGGNFFYLANHIFSGTGCTTTGCTFQQAMAVASSLRNSPQFSNYCCRDYSVWENTQTGKMTVVLGKFGTAGFGWRVVKSDLCCEEAEALAGIPGACSGATQVQCVPGSYSAVNPQTQKVECICNPGLVWNSTRTACVDPKELVKGTDCSVYYPGSYAAWNAEAQRVECYCPTGKKWNDTKTACIDDASQVNCWPGSYPALNPQTNRIECYCKPGLVWNSTKTACVEPAELVKNADCSRYPGSYAAWNTQTQKVECWCPAGKKWNSTMTACIDDVITTTTQCWPGSYAAVNPQTNKTECYCNPGLVWNSTKTACIDPQELVKNTNCSAYPGSYAAWNTQTQRVECWCPQGKVWNSTLTACIDAPTLTTTNNNNPGNITPGTCSSNDAATFAKIAGSWKSYRMHVTIGGSCDNVTGTWKVTEWCEGVDETYNASVARVIGTITGGKMQGGSLQVNFESPPSPNNSKGTKGTGSCYLRSDGTLSCSFGCPGDLKKQ